MTEPAALPQKLNSLAENMPGEGQGKASVSELPYGGYLPLCQQRASTAEAACRTRWRRPEREACARRWEAAFAGGQGKQRRREEKVCIIVKYNSNKNIYLWTRKTLTRNKK